MGAIVLVYDRVDLGACGNKLGLATERNRRIAEDDDFTKKKGFVVEPVIEVTAERNGRRIQAVNYECSNIDPVIWMEERATKDAAYAAGDEFEPALASSKRRGTVRICDIAIGCRRKLQDSLAFHDVPGSQKDPFTYVKGGANRLCAVRTANGTVCDCGRVCLEELAGRLG